METMILNGMIYSREITTEYDEVIKDKLLAAREDKRKCEFKSEGDFALIGRVKKLEFYSKLGLVTITLEGQ